MNRIDRRNKLTLPNSKVKLPGLGIPLMNSNPMRDENDVLLRDELIINFLLEDSKTHEEIMKCRQEEGNLNPNIIENNGNIIMTGGSMIRGSLLGRSFLVDSTASILSDSSTTTKQKKPFNFLDNDDINDDNSNIKSSTFIKSKCWTDKMITDDLIIRSMLKLIQKQIDVQEENEFFGESS